MGRAYEVRKASIQKTGAAKSKIYSMYAREIYQAAKNGGVEMTANPILKRLVERAKDEQVPADIIKRAIDKVNAGASENYEDVKYELFGPGGSTLIVECFTDNLNRSISSVRAVLNKCHVKMGQIGSVSYMYENLCAVGVKIKEEEALDMMIEAGIEITDIETEDDMTIIYGVPQDLYAIKEAILKNVPNIKFEIDEITMIPKQTVTLNSEDQELFNKLYGMLDDIEDVAHIYHNVEM